MLFGFAGTVPRSASLGCSPSQTTLLLGSRPLCTSGQKIKDFRTRAEDKPGQQGPWDALWGGPGAGRGRVQTTVCLGEERGLCSLPAWGEMSSFSKYSRHLWPEHMLPGLFGKPPTTGLPGPECHSGEDMPWKVTPDALSQLSRDGHVTAVLGARKTLVPTLAVSPSHGVPLSPLVGSEAPSSLTPSLGFHGHISSVPPLPASICITSKRITAAGTGAREAPEADPVGRRIASDS